MNGCVMRPSTLRSVRVCSTCRGQGAGDSGPHGVGVATVKHRRDSTVREHARTYLVALDDVGLGQHLHRVYAARVALSHLHDLAEGALAHDLEQHELAQADLGKCRARRV